MPRKPLKKNTKKKVFMRDGYMCVRCNSMMDLTVDHIKPVILGGSNELDNLQTMCEPCNKAKDRTDTSVLQTV